MVTENLAMQIMDYLEPNISHEPTAYNGYVNDFKGIFRSTAFNKVLIDFVKVFEIKICYTCQVCRERFFLRAQVLHVP